MYLYGNEDDNDKKLAKIESRQINGDEHSTFCFNTSDYHFRGVDQITFSFVDGRPFSIGIDRGNYEGGEIWHYYNTKEEFWQLIEQAKKISNPVHYQKMIDYINTNKDKESKFWDKPEFKSQSPY